MTKAEYYRKQHRERQEEPLAISILSLGLIVLGIMAWLGFFFVMFEEM